MSELVGEGPEPYPRCIRIKQRCGFLFGYIGEHRLTKSQRFIGAKFGMCGRELNAGEEI